MFTQIFISLKKQASCLSHQRFINCFLELGSNSHCWFVCSLQLKTVARSCMHCDGCRVHSPNCQVCNSWKRACLKHGWLLGMWLSLGSRWLLQNQPQKAVMNCLGMSTGMLPYFASMSCPPFAYFITQSPCFPPFFFHLDLSFYFEGWWVMRQVPSILSYCFWFVI